MAISKVRVIDEWADLLTSFERALRAGTQTPTGKPASPATLRSYREASEPFRELMTRRGYPADTAEVPA